MLSQSQQEAFDEILAEHDGELTDEMLLEAVEERGEACALHGLVFNCTDGEAARRYRLVQCQWILRHAKFKLVAKGNVHPMEARRVVNVKQESERYYLATEQALKNKAFRSQLEDECVKELEEWYDKWAAILGYPVVDALRVGFTCEAAT